MYGEAVFPTGRSGLRMPLALIRASHAHILTTAMLCEDQDVSDRGGPASIKTSSPQICSSFLPRTIKRTSTLLPPPSLKKRLLNSGRHVSIDDETIANSLKKTEGGDKDRVDTPASIFINGTASGSFALLVEGLSLIFLLDLEHRSMTDSSSEVAADIRPLNQRMSAKIRSNVSAMGGNVTHLVLSVQAFRMLLQTIAPVLTFAVFSLFLSN